MDDFQKIACGFLSARVEIVMLKRWKDSSRSLSGNISCMSAGSKSAGLVFINCGCLKAL